MATTRENAAFRELFVSDDMLDDAIQWIQENLPPGDVFDEGALRDWAHDDDFVPGDEVQTLRERIEELEGELADAQNAASAEGGPA